MPDPNANATENPGSDTSPFLRMWAVTRMTGANPHEGWPPVRGETQGLW